MPTPSPLARLLDGGVRPDQSPAARSLLRLGNSIALTDGGTGLMLAGLLSWLGGTPLWALFIAVCFAPQVAPLWLNRVGRASLARIITVFWTPFAILATSLVVGPEVHIELGLVVSLSAGLLLVPLGVPWRRAMLAWHFVCLLLILVFRTLSDFPGLVPLEWSATATGFLVFITLANVAQRLNALLHQLRDQVQQTEAARVAAERASAAKTVFLAHMTHELRTPLGAVVGLNELLADTPLAPDQAQLVRRSQRSADHLMTLINQLLDLARAESGALQLAREPFDLIDCLDEAVALCQHRADRKGLPLRLDTAALAAARWRLGDALRLKQVVVNLVANAVKFTDRGEVSVEATARPGTDGGPPWVDIAVRDTGIGITEAQRATIFRPFQQADASIARRFGGTGLGLAISLQLAEASGGALTVDSRPGAGSTFTLQLPLPLTTAPEAAAPAPAALERRLRILVAEDNPVVQHVLRKLFEKLGQDPVMVGDGVEALARARSERWDVVFLDMRMPRLEGPATARALRAGGYAGRLCALTASVHADEHQECLDAGMDAVLVKPVSLEWLHRELASTEPLAAR